MQVYTTCIHVMSGECGKFRWKIYTGSKTYKGWGGEKAWNRKMDKLSKLRKSHYQTGSHSDD